MLVLLQMGCKNQFSWTLHVVHYPEPITEGILFQNKENITLCSICAILFNIFLGFSSQIVSFRLHFMLYKYKKDK